MLFAFNGTQLEQIKTFAFQLPHHLRSQYLHHLAKLLPQDFSDADVWRAAHKAANEVVYAATHVGQRPLQSDAGKRASRHLRQVRADQVASRVQVSGIRFDWNRKGQRGAASGSHEGLS
jgi:hypothetical protein